MSDTYRPGDIAMVDGKPAVWITSPVDADIWDWMDGGWTVNPREVGPVLGNVADIAAAGQVEWAASDGLSVELEMWPTIATIRASREFAEAEFVHDGDDVLLRRLVTPWQVVPIAEEAP